MRGGGSKDVLNWVAPTGQTAPNTGKRARRGPHVRRAGLIQFNGETAKTIRISRICFFSSSHDPAACPNPWIPLHTPDWMRPLSTGGFGVWIDSGQNLQLSPVTWAWRGRGRVKEGRERERLTHMVQCSLCLSEGGGEHEAGLRWAAAANYRGGMEQRAASPRIAQERRRPHSIDRGLD